MNVFLMVLGFVSLCAVFTAFGDETDHPPFGDLEAV